MKKLTILSALGLFFILNLNAQDKAADLKRLFVVMQSEKMIDNMMDGIIPAMKQQAGTQIQGTDAKQKLDQYMDFVMSETKNLSKKIINEEMPAIYDKFFTHEDIKDLIKFYESPTGKKMLEKTPEITANLMNSMMVKYLPDFQQKVTEKMNDFK